jgi:surface protein
MNRLFIFCNFLLVFTVNAYSQDFMTKWKFDDAATGINFLSFSDGVTDYTWSASPSGNSGSGTLPIGGSGGVFGLNISAGDVVTLSLSPSNLKRFYIGYGQDRLKLMDVSQWGSAQWTSMESSFNGCENFNISASDVPNLDNVSNMSTMFANAKSFNSNIGNWNTSNVTNMSFMFQGANAYNQDVGNWNTAQVTNMEGMFIQASAFNQNIGNWNTAQVTNMQGMFGGAISFNSPIGNWNTAQVTNMQGMFGGAISFNSPIGNWDVSKVTNMQAMFGSASIFNQDIGNWNTTKVTKMAAMFVFANAFNQNIGNWDVSMVTEMQQMFLAAKNFNQNIGNWNTSKVTNMASLFQGAITFNQDLSNWNTANVTNMSGMFSQTLSFNQNIGNWNTAKVTDMSYMFYNVNAFNQNLGNWDISKVTDMTGILYSTGLDCNNYSATLYGWNGSAGNASGLQLDATNLQYGTSIVTIRNELINSKGWTINGDSPSSSSCSTQIQGCVYKPSNGSKNVPITTDISWFPTDMATGYMLVVGTKADTSDIVDSVDVGNVLTYNLPSNLAYDTKFFVNVIPYNASGFLVGCRQISFTTENQNFITKWNFTSASSIIRFNALTDSIVTYSWTAAPSGASGTGSFISLSSGAVTLSGLNIAAGDVVTLSMAPNKLRRFYINEGPDKNQLIDVGQWGIVPWSSMNGAFYGCSNFNISAIDRPDLSTVNDMSFMFANASIFNSNIDDWNTSSVINMSYLFSSAIAFNSDISNWNTSNVMDMSYMFNNALAFNQDLGNWNTFNVVNMSNMFNSAIAFNSYINDWSTSNVINMSSMFQNASNYNQDLGSWNTDNVTNMSNMFNTAIAFNQDIGNWNTFNVVNMNAMFNNAVVFNQNLENWKLTNISLMLNMLDNCGMDCNNYSATLIGWKNNNSLTTSRTLGAVGRQFGTNSVDARNILINLRGWTINGDLPSGYYCGIVFPKILTLENANTIKIKYYSDIDPLTVNDINIFISADETGLRKGQFFVNRDTITFVSNTNFRAGEIIHVSSKNGIKYTTGLNAPSYSWQIQSMVTNKTNSKFNIYNTGIELAAGATNYKYSSAMCDMNLDGREDIIFNYNNAAGSPTNTLVYLKGSNGRYDNLFTYTNIQSNRCVKQIALNH